MYSLLDMLDTPVDYSASKVLVPLSAGINSAAVLAVLGEHHPEHLKPKELHLYYAHLREHSPDSFKFVADCVRYARRKFPDVRVRITRDSVNQFFVEQQTIPHPTLSPCSRMIKIEPMQAYDLRHQINFVLIGFVKSEIKTRHAKAVKRQKKTGRTKDVYPILSLTDEDCFAIVKDVIGWYPAIYDIRWTAADAVNKQCRPFEVGRRVFTHNNCLPCKNMTSRQLREVGRHYPQYAERAEAAAAQIPNAYWGRDDVPDVFKCDVCERM